MKDRKRKKGTKTSAFGSPGRTSHDSSEFYAGELYKGSRNAGDEEYVENPAAEEAINRIYCKSSEEMSELPDCSVHLMVTSPPYNARKEYDEDLSLDEYRELLRSVFSETWRKLATGGRACVNIANLGRKPYIPLHKYVIADMLDVGYLMRGEIIWDKGSSAGSSTAWGSWRSATNPVLRDVHEYIMVFSKDTFSRRRNGKEDTITKDDFLDWTKSVWRFPAVSAKSVGHPAPFPEELPRRLIQMYTFKGDLVLDPFCGSGATCLAALKSGRNFVGYDINDEYVKMATGKVNEALSQGRLFDGA